MKKRLFFYLFAVISFPFMFLSCTVEDSGEIESFYFTVEGNQWQWNSIYGRYECSFSFPQLSSDIYKEGSISGSVFVYEEDQRGRTYETQKNLPFSQTYLSRQIPYMETISFDVSPGSPYSIAFYIQASDMQGVSLLTYDFKITLAYIR